MTTNILLLHYNNYFNRIVKKLATVDEYKAADPDYAICNYVNFVPGDGVTTSLVLGQGTNPSNLFDDGPNFDYLVVMDSTSPDYSIVSRWFITEAVRTREGQYELSLKRDVIVDHYDDIVNSPIYIEKGYISNTSDPLLYNKEGLEVNQIKQSEIAIKDKTECGWVIGYVPYDSFDTDAAADRTIEATAIVSQNADITVTSLDAWSYWGYCDLNPNVKSLGKVNTKKELFFKLKSIYQNGNNLYYYCQSVGSYIGADEG